MIHWNRDWMHPPYLLINRVLCVWWGEGVEVVEGVARNHVQQLIRPRRARHALPPPPRSLLVTATQSKLSNLFYFQLQCSQVPDQVCEWDVVRI